jgi:hypothetical protein
MRVVSFDVGTRNLAFVVADVGADVAVRAWRSVSVVDGPVTRMPKSGVIEALLAALHDLDELLECDTVLIETQPRFAPLNLQVAHAVEAFFLLRKRVDLGEPVAVHYVHAGLKNQLCAAVAVARPAGLTPRYAKYKANKQRAVAACAALVARDAALAALWAAFPKKDDPADCLLQLLAWLRLPLASARVRA